MAHWPEITNQLMAGNTISLCGYSKKTATTCINRCLHTIKKEYKRMGMIAPIFSLTVLQVEDNKLSIKLTEVACEISGSGNET